VLPKFPNVNNSKTKSRHSGRLILTNETRKIKEILQLEAMKQMKKVGDIFKSFDPAIHYLEAEYMFYTPKLFTLKGTINMNKPDWDGNIKHVQDACCMAMGIDDSFIISSKVDQFKSKSDDEVFICIYRLCYQNSRFS